MADDVASKVDREAPPLDGEPDADEDRTAELRALWTALETEGTLPTGQRLASLSGLLDDAIAHAAGAWHALALVVRRDLVQRLVDLAGDDYALDFSAVYRIAMEDADAQVRAIAIGGLEETEDARLIPSLIRTLQDDPADTARAAAARGLGKYVLLGELEKIRPRAFNMAVDALRDAYMDPSEATQVRCQALRSVAYTESKGVPELIAGAYGDQDEALRISAIHAMGRSANATWSAQVQRELTSATPDMRLEAARACGELQLAEAVDDIAALADDVDQRIRLAALRALGQIGGNVAERELQRYTGDEEEAIRGAAEQALQELAFFSGDLMEFFRPAGGAGSQAEALWHLPGYINQDDNDDAGSVG